MSSNSILLLYFFSWLITFVLYIRRRKCVDAGAILLLSYTIFAFSSYLLYNNFYSDGLFQEITFLPFLYLYLMLLITSVPILKFKPTYIIQNPNRILINYFAIIYFVCSLITAYATLPNIGDGIKTIVIDSAGADLYHEAHEEVFYDNVPFFVRIGTAINNIFSDISILFLFYYMSLPKRNNYIILFLSLGVFLTIFGSVAQGLRTVATMKIFLMISTYFLFGNRIDMTIRKKIRKIGIALFSVVLLIMTIVTVSRFSNEYESMSYYIESYAGQGNLYFNNYAFDSGGIRDGDRTCNTFKRMLGYDDVPEGPYKTRNKHSYMKISEKNFITFVGDFILDFGPVIATIILLVSTFLLRIGSIAHKRKLYFHQLILIYFCLCVCMQGGMYLFYYSYKGNYTIIAFLIVYLAFKVEHNFSKTGLCLNEH